MRIIGFLLLALLASWCAVVAAEAGWYLMLPPPKDLFAPLSSSWRTFFVFDDAAQCQLDLLLYKRIAAAHTFDEALQAMREHELSDMARKYGPGIIRRSEGDPGFEAMVRENTKKALTTFGDPPWLMPAFRLAQCVATDDPRIAR